jgi:hypothetical protein
MDIAEVGQTDHADASVEKSSMLFVVLRINAILRSAPQRGCR